MNVAIMQPYFLPYIGYFQLINAADTFVVYDNIEFTKKGWYNRNRILMNGADHLFTIPIRKNSDYLHVIQRSLAEDAEKEIRKILAQISNSYRKAPFFKEHFPFIESLFLYTEKNLFKFIYNSIEKMCSFLGISSKLLISSTIDISHDDLQGQDKVIAICKKTEATRYINPIGGLTLYNESNFKKNNIELRFLKTNFVPYSQGTIDFIPGLSIIDVLMFNSLEQTKNMLSSYDLIHPIQ